MNLLANYVPKYVSSKATEGTCDFGEEWVFEGVK